MEAPKDFKIVIKQYLDQRAVDDKLFAATYAKPGKSVDDCCRYILGEARKRGTEVVMKDDEVFGMAVHYYDEENIKIEKVSAGSSVSSSHKVELTEEERTLPVRLPSRDWPKNNTDRSKRSRLRKKVDESVQQMSLF